MTEPYTYDFYQKLLARLTECGYFFGFFDETAPQTFNDNDRVVFLRHDVDFSPEKAKTLIEIESKHEISSTFFLMIGSGFYDIHVPKTYGIFKNAVENGSRLGLHYDMLNEFESNDINESVQGQKKILLELFLTSIDAVSFHRPATVFKKGESQEFDFNHTHMDIFSKECRYISDARKQLNCDDLYKSIKETGLDKLHLVIHPLWWNEGYQDAQTDYEDFLEEKQRQLRNNIMCNSKIFRM